MQWIEEPPADPRSTETPSPQIVEQASSQGVARDQQTFKETVIVIHGTFAAPKSTAADDLRSEKAAEWYLPAGNFCKALDEVLKHQGSRARCWAHPDTPFTWSGANSWLERLHWGRELARQLKRLTSDGWVWHVVAHSHGGNVLLHALSELGDSFPRTSKICLIGTPILSVKKSASSKLRALTNPSIASFIFICACLAIVAVLTGFDLTILYYIFNRSLWIYIAAFVILVILLRPLLPSELHSIRTPSTYTGGPLGDEQLLLISSQYDEAFDLLNFVRAETDPLHTAELRFRIFDAIRLSWRDAHLSVRERYGVMSAGSVALFAALISSLGLLYYKITLEPTWHFSDGGEILVYGIAALFLISAVFPLALWRAGLLPLYLLAYPLWTIVAFCRSVVSLMIQKRAWRTLQEYAYGLSGSPYGLAQIELNRRGIRTSIGCMGVNLDRDAETKAVENRRNSLDDVVNIVKTMVNKEDKIETGLIPLMNEVATRADLVHAAYYAQPEGISQIGTWLAMSREEGHLRSLQKQREDEGGLLARDDRVALEEEISGMREKLLSRMTNEEKQAYYGRDHSRSNPYRVYEVWVNASE